MGVDSSHFTQFQGRKLDKNKVVRVLGQERSRDKTIDILYQEADFNSKLINAEEPRDNGVSLRVRSWRIGTRARKRY